MFGLFKKKGMCDCKSPNMKTGRYRTGDTAVPSEQVTFEDLPLKGGGHTMVTGFKCRKCKRFMFMPEDNLKLFLENAYNDEWRNVFLEKVLNGATYEQVMKQFKEKENE